MEMMKESTVDKAQQDVVKPACFGNWTDIYGYPITSKILPLVARINWITPNFVTLFSFFMFIAGCILLFYRVPYHQYISAFLLLSAYIGDQLDGQLARSKNLSSRIGNYLDKVIDVIKIYAITVSLSWAAYSLHQDVMYV